MALAWSFFCGGWFVETVLSAEIRMVSWQCHAGETHLRDIINNMLRSPCNAGVVVLMIIYMFWWILKHYIAMWKWILRDKMSLFPPILSKLHLLVCERAPETMEENWQRGCVKALLGLLTWAILAVEYCFHRRRSQEAKLGELSYTMSWCQHHSYNVSLFRLIPFCRQRSSNVSTKSFMCFVQIAGNRAALFIAPYHQVQRHSWSQAFPPLEAQDPPRAILCFFWLGTSQFLLLAPNLGFYHGAGETQHCQAHLGQAHIKAMSHVATKVTFAFSQE